MRWTASTRSRPPRTSSIKLARLPPEAELGMDVLVAEAVLELGDELHVATQAVHLRSLRDAFSAG